LRPDSILEVGQGISREEDAFTAGRGAAGMAMSTVSRQPVAAVIVYASASYDLRELLRGVRQVVGDALVFGTTTAGEIRGGLYHGGVVVCVLASTYLTVRCAIGRDVAQDWRRATETAMADPAVRPYFDSDPDGQWRRTSEGKTVFTMLFSPGNRRGADSKSYEITEFLKASTLSLMPIIGGASADDWRMESNSVLLGNDVYPDSLLLAVFETQLQCGLALGHGFQPTTTRTVVTAADDHEVLTLDGRAAAEALSGLLGQAPDQLSGRHITLTTGRMAGTADPMGQYSVNVVSFFTERGGVRFTQPLAVGTTVTVMAAEPQAMVSAGREVIRKALLRGGIARPAVALVAYCALRPRIIGEDAAARDLDGMVDLLGDAPLLGFCSFGEQGVADDGVSRHNNGAISALVIGDSLSQTALVAIENQRLRAEMSEKAEELQSVHQSLRQAYDDLEQRVADRTRALDDRTQELERSNADLERFAYVASHDLQTPLRNIISYTQLLERRYRGQLGADADEFVSFIVGGAKQMARLITDLLDYARDTSQGQPLVPISARQALDGALANLKSAIAETEAEISAGDLPDVLADKTQLVSLFQNLIGNALKYRHHDRVPKVEITAERQSPTQWRIAVADNGIGIEHAYFGKIFEIFQRLAPDANSGGTGIGLAVCQRIVHRFGGEILVESIPGEGAIFFFTIGAA